MSATVQYAGRRGGLARQSAPAEAADSGTIAGAVTVGSRLTRVRERVRWTLVFSAFFAFTGGVVSSRFAIGQPMIVLGVIGVMLQSEPLRTGPVPSLLSLWTVWAALGCFVTPHPNAAWDSLIQLTKLCVITFVGVNALRTRGQLRAYSVFVLFAFLLYPGRGSLLNWLTGAFVVAGSRAVWNGVYSNPNDLAGIALLIVSVALATFAGERDKRLKLVALGVTGFVTFIIFITQSRGALVALGVFVVVAVRRMPKRQRLRAAMAAGVLAAVMVAFAPASVWQRLAGLKNIGNTAELSQVDPEGSAEQRFEIWKVARTIIAEHPLTGVGIGAYSAEHGIVSQRSDFKPTARGQRDTHSMYFNVMAETGLPGFLIFMSITGVTIAYAERVRRRWASAVPDMALQLQFLELGLLAFFIAGVWGSYGKLNMLYLQLVLIWATAKLLEQTGRSGGHIVGVPRPAVSGGR